MPNLLKDFEYVFRFLWLNEMATILNSGWLQEARIVLKDNSTSSSRFRYVIHHFSNISSIAVTKSSRCFSCKFVISFSLVWTRKIIDNNWLKLLFSLFRRPVETVRVWGQAYFDVFYFYHFERISYIETKKCHAFLCV